MTLALIRRAIDFQNLSFSYDTQPVLREIDLHIESGEIVAIVGHRGAGKSSLFAA
jgi:ABC-type multidrug transport system fused ATPase/permease subunit